MELVKGYMILTEQLINGHIVEQLFALYEDGTIKTCTKRYSNSFVEPGVEWKETSHIPSEAEFIGNYKL